MRDSVMWFLVCSVLFSAMYVVYYRHQHRIVYVTYLGEETRRDALNDEWGELLIEENSRSAHHYIENFASKKLSMRMPTDKETRYIEVGGDYVE